MAGRPRRRWLRQVATSSCSLARDQAITDVLNQLPPYLADSASLIYSLKAADAAIKDLLALGTNAANWELRLAAAMSDITVSTVAYTLRHLANDPPNADYKNVLSVLVIDLAQLRSILGTDPASDASFALIDSAMKALQGAIVALSGAERGQAALAAGDMQAYTSQAGSFFAGLDELQSATNDFGNSLTAWDGSLRQSGFYNQAPLNTTFDFSQLTGADIDQIRQGLVDTGLFDQSAIDSAITSVLQSAPVQFDGMPYDLSVLGAQLSSARPLDARVLPEPPTLGLVFVAILAAGAVRRRHGMFQKRI
jgi:hypothetical protein